MATAEAGTRGDAHDATNDGEEASQAHPLPAQVLACLVGGCNSLVLRRAELASRLPHTLVEQGQVRLNATGANRIVIVV
jgi:hypothetical protein